MKPIWHDCIDLEDLPERYQSIASAIGLDATIDLALYMPKMNLYLKHPSKIDFDGPREQLSEDYQLVIEAIGIDLTKLLAESSPSGFIYLLSPDTVFLPAKIKYIHKHFNGRNHRRLAIATGTCQAFVYDTLRAPTPIQEAFNF